MIEQTNDHYARMKDLKQTNLMVNTTTD